MTNKNLSNIIIWAENKPGVYYRILWLFRRKMFNIESATVSHTEIPGVSRFTITVAGDKKLIHNMTKQINKLINIIKVEDIPEEKLVARELALIKVSGTKKSDRLQILEVVKHFRARVVNMVPDRMIIEITGNEDKIDAFYENMKQFNILEFVRTGRTALYK